MQALQNATRTPEGVVMNGFTLSPRCNFATHVKLEVTAAAKVNPLKASKRAAKGR